MFYFSNSFRLNLSLKNPVEYILGFKALNKTEQASNTFLNRISVKSNDLLFNDAFKGMVWAKRLAGEMFMCVCGFKHTL